MNNGNESKQSSGCETRKSNRLWRDCSEINSIECATAEACNGRTGVMNPAFPSFQRCYNSVLVLLLDSNLCATSPLRCSVFRPPCYWESYKRLVIEVPLKCNTIAHPLILQIALIFQKFLNKIRVKPTHWVHLKEYDGHLMPLWVLNCGPSLMI